MGFIVALIDYLCLADVDSHTHCLACFGEHIGNCVEVSFWVSVCVCA